MSNHLIDCASLVQDLVGTHKLLLLCLADDSRDGSGRIASPGHDKAAAWTGLGPSALYDAFNALKERGLIAQHQRGQKHRNAEYLVFPAGCCELHQRLDVQTLPGLSGSGTPDPETASTPLDNTSQPPVHRTLSDSQPPVEALSASGLADSASGLDRRPPQVSPLRTTLPQPPDRPAPPMREEAEGWQQVFDNRDTLDEFCAEVRTIRRGIDKPSGRWTAHAIRSAIAKALEVGYAPADIPSALRVVAADRLTELPGRVAAAGPWWDASEANELERRRATHRQAEADAAATRAACSCDRGWVDGPDGLPSHCPTCRPQTFRSHA